MKDQLRDQINAALMEAALKPATFEMVTEAIKQGERDAQRADTNRDLLKESNEQLKEARSDLSAANHRNAELTKRVEELESAVTSKLVAEAKADTLKECFGLVFRNTAVRQRVTGNENVPVGGTHDMMGYAQSMPVDRTTETEDV
ncbi:hypothetical protein [uncultured Pelagimonas sp.]|uniref:hypothetical protein n=1 Tax=uncultured Pelagimonas sp. TaxID=1618102 RepID=UPI0026299EAC|nr:hypothetical protein [uncultured Pelagimonas sp.]